VGTRINKYGDWEIGAAENISYGKNDATDILMQLYVDDGVPSRGHRKNLMYAGSKVTAVCSVKHPRYKYMTAIVYSGGFTIKEKGIK
jgi:uncharacterized protein YkwD